MNPKALAKIAIQKGAVQKIKELHLLISLLKKRKLNRVIEIGTFKGGTFYALCKLAQPGAVVISIDLPKGPFGGGYTILDMKKFKTYKRKKQKLYFLRNDSHERNTKQKIIEILKDKKIDLLLVDGDHRYDGVKKDWELYSPLVRKNGLIVFHDILHHPKVPKCEVDKLWKEIKTNYKFVEFVDKNDDQGWGQWGGIGVIYYNSR